MRFFPNPTRPDFIFATIWLFVLAIYIPIPTLITPELPPGLMTVLLLNIVSGPLIYALLRRRIEQRLGRREQDGKYYLSPWDEHIIADFLKLMIMFWGTVFLLSIVVSGGLPIIWYLTGDPREYADFGIPTLGGLGDMFRCFGAVLCILLFLNSRKKKYILLWIFHLLPSIAIVSRGGLAVFLLQNIAALLMLQQFRLRQVLIALGIVMFAAGAFVILGELRGIRMNADDIQGVGEYFGGLPVGLYWFWTYIASPLGNVANLVSLELSPDYLPQQTLVYLLPSVFREALFSGRIYTPLNTEQLNATSIYSPLITDFGLIGAGLAIATFMTACSYVHIMARRGNLFYVMMYPALYAALGLSFFHIFALTPGVVAVPFLCVWFKKYVERRQNALQGRNLGFAH